MAMTRRPFELARPAWASRRRTLATSSTQPGAPRAPFAVLQTVEQVRRWRMDRLLRGESVGFVPTMGNLHEGHLNLVRHSLSSCDHTVPSIFVNPAQFAPHEDLATYPRTLESDISHLASLAVEPGSLSVPKGFDVLPSTTPAPTTPPPSQPPSPGASADARRVSALFLPSVDTLYPSGIEQDVSKQTGTFVDVKGFSHQMEGRTRPTFFRGVATVVLKLFNIVQPDQTFFGQKDIQQCIVLRQMLRDLHLAHPSSPSSLVVVPTSRDPSSGLALSSRNTYLSDAQRRAAVCLSRSLFAARSLYLSKKQASTPTPIPTGELVEASKLVIRDEVERAAEGGDRLELDYLSVNDPVSLRDLDAVEPGKGFIISGALWCGKTRLIDNLVIDFDLNP